MLLYSHVLAHLIRPDGVVFDFGVSEGRFSTRVAILGLEPDPGWTARRLLPDNVMVVPKALGADGGIIRLHLNREKCSSLHCSDPDAASLEVELSVGEVGLRKGIGYACETARLLGDKAEFRWVGARSQSGLMRGRRASPIFIWLAQFQEVRWSHISNGLTYSLCHQCVRGRRR